MMLLLVRGGQDVCVFACVCGDNSDDIHDHGGGSNVRACGDLVAAGIRLRQHRRSS